MVDGIRDVLTGVRGRKESEITGSHLDQKFQSFNTAPNNRTMTMRS